MRVGQRRGVECSTSQTTAELTASFIQSWLAGNRNRRTKRWDEKPQARLTTALIHSGLKHTTDTMITLIKRDTLPAPPGVQMHSQRRYNIS